MTRTVWIVLAVIVALVLLAGLAQLLVQPGS
jgi:hypothetical protein